MDVSNCKKKSQCSERAAIAVCTRTQLQFHVTLKMMFSFYIITFIFYIEISILIVNKFSKQSTRLTRMLQSPTMQQMESKCFLDFQLISTIYRLKLFISFTTICDKKYLIRLKSKRFSCGISTHLMQLYTIPNIHSYLLIETPVCTKASWDWNRRLHSIVFAC